MQPVEKAVVQHFSRLLLTHRYDVTLIMRSCEVDEVLHLTITHKRKWLQKVEVGLPEILKQSRRYLHGKMSAHIVRFRHLDPFVRGVQDAAPSLN